MKWAFTLFCVQVHTFVQSGTGVACLGRFLIIYVCTRLCFIRETRKEVA